jgi:hypothetical protein
LRAIVDFCRRWSLGRGALLLGPWLTACTIYDPSLLGDKGAGGEKNEPDGGLPPIDGTFVRAINLGGPGLTIDGHDWESGNTAEGFALIRGETLNEQDATLDPSTDDNRATMIRSSLHDTVSFNLTIPDGPYKILLYTWEDDEPTTFSVTIDGERVLSEYSSGAAGTWTRHGPWQLQITTGAINLNETGDGNLSGIEIYQ